MDISKLTQPKSKDFKLESITNVNFDPHPFMIGPKHVAYASDNHSGMLGEATLKAVPCAMKGCQLPHSEHKSDKVLFIKALVDKEPSKLRGLKKYLLSIKKELGKHSIDGVAFIAPTK